jgi:tripartite-type tricarboxylate transporter receptor subunit TctC
MRHMRRARPAVLAAFAGAFCIASSDASGQGFPGKPVRYVVPFGAGGSPDIVGRLLAERLTRLWGQQVVVENRVGAAGVLGTAYVAKSPPDGHTLVQCNIASSGIAVSLYAKMPYDHLRDIAAVARIGLLPNVLTVHPSVPLKSMKEYIGYAKAYPGRMSYAAGLVGTSPQLSMELLRLIAKIEIVHIPYKVGAQGVTDTVAGQVPSGIFNLPVSVPHVQSKRLRALAVTTAQRAWQLPDVPTMQEAGLPGYEVSSWYGVCAPAATPAPILDKLHTDITAVLNTPEVNERLRDLLQPAPSSRDDFDRFIRAEIAR